MRNFLPAELKQFPLLCLLVALLVALLAATGLLQPQYQFNQGVFVPLHTAMHVFSLVIAWLVFAIGWNTHDPERAGSVTLLACGFLGVALLDFGHALSYEGMPDLVTPASPEKSIDFSLVSRLFARTRSARARRHSKATPAGSQLSIPVSRLNACPRRACLLGGAAPPSRASAHLRAGVGADTAQSSLRIRAGRAALVAASGFYRQLRTAPSSNAAYLFAASIAMALSQVLNALYFHPYDVHNFLSHAYRVVGYILIYRGIFLSEMREPYNVAERLQTELRSSATRLREMSARMQHDIEEERKRISQSLHDEMGQNLTALQLDADWIRRHCQGRGCRSRRGRPHATQHRRQRRLDAPDRGRHAAARAGRPRHHRGDQGPGEGRLDAHRHRGGVRVRRASWTTSTTPSRPRCTGCCRSV